MAVRQWRVHKQMPLVHHSDRGSQYCSKTLYRISKTERYNYQYDRKMVTLMRMQLPNIN